MEFRLAPEAEARGYGLRAFETVGSTSAEALTLAREGVPGRLWVVAREQTAGRGRRGRRWETRRGNLAASLMLRTEAPALLTASLGFVAGLALDRALRACCGSAAEVGIGLDGVRPVVAGSRIEFALKWPNDVLANGAKIAGILLESETRSDASRPVVVGIGVNVTSAPERMPYPATSLAALGASVRAETLFEALSAAWVRFYDLWDESRGFAAVRDAWLDAAAGLGGPVAVRHGAEVTRGVFETIDDHGYLVIRTSEGAARRVSAGEVHFGLAATVPA